MSEFNFIFLGTSAYDYSKKLETEFKDKFGYDERRAACGLLNGQYLIDCGFHCADSLRIAKIDKTKITDIIITHLHDDHCNFAFIEDLAKIKKEPLNVYVRHDAEVPEINNVNWVKMDKMKEYSLPDLTTVKG